MPKHYNYYKLIGNFDGQQDVLFGAYLRSECVYEKRAEREQLLDAGYLKLTIITEKTTTAPDPEVYTSRQLAVIEMDAK